MNSVLCFLMNHRLGSSLSGERVKVKLLFLCLFFSVKSAIQTDVNSWLVTFGFQLYNVIPGYKKPVVDTMEPSYELIHTQMKTQEWDSTKVRQPLPSYPQISACHFSHPSLPYVSDRSFRLLSEIAPTLLFRTSKSLRKD